MCLPMVAHWRHLANTIELVLPSAHPSTQPKWQIDRFSCFCPAHGRKSLYFTMVDPFPQDCPSRGGSGPPSYSWFLGPVRVHNPNGIIIAVQLFSHRWPQSVSILYNGRPFTPKVAPCHGATGPPNLIRGSLGQPESSTQTVSRSVQPFLHRWPQSVHILYNGTPISPLKIAPSHGGSGRPSNTWSLGPTQVLNPNGISIGAVVFAGLTSVTDRQTDRSTDHASRSLTIDRIYVRSKLTTTMRSKKHSLSWQYSLLYWTTSWRSAWVNFKLKNIYTIYQKVTPKYKSMKLWHILFE